MLFSYLVNSSMLTICFFSLLTPSGGDLWDGDPADEIPRVAAVRLLPGAGVGLQAPDGGHAGGAALCHCGGGGPCNWHVCQQHCALPTTVQQDGGVSDPPTQHCYSQGEHTLKNISQYAVCCGTVIQGSLNQNNSKRRSLTMTWSSVGSWESVSLS